MRARLDHRDGIKAPSRLGHPQHNRAHRHILGFQRFHAQAQCVQWLHGRHFFHRLLPFSQCHVILCGTQPDMSYGDTSPFQWGKEGRLAKATPAPTPKRCIYGQLTDGAYHIREIGCPLVSNRIQAAYTTRGASRYGMVRSQSIVYTPSRCGSRPRRLTLRHAAAYNWERMLTDRRVGS